MWYGLPFVSYGVVLVATVNSIGAVFQLAYTAVFIAFADAKQRVGARLRSCLSCVILFISIDYILNEFLSLFAAQGLCSPGRRLCGVRTDCVC